jgi:hypothetical protein
MTDKTAMKKNLTIKEKMTTEEEEEKMMIMLMMVVMTTKLTVASMTAALAFPCGDTSLSQTLHAILITSEVNGRSVLRHCMPF